MIVDVNFKYTPKVGMPTNYIHFLEFKICCQLLKLGALNTDRKIERYQVQEEQKHGF